MILSTRKEEMSALSTTQVSPSSDVLEANDVLLEVDGEVVANDGTVSFRGWERVAFDHLISLKEPGQEVRLKVRRRITPPPENKIESTSNADADADKENDQTQTAKHTNGTNGMTATTANDANATEKTTATNEKETTAAAAAAAAAAGNTVESEVIIATVAVQPRETLVPAGASTHTPPLLYAAAFTRLWFCFNPQANQTSDRVDCGVVVRN